MAEDTESIQMSIQGMDCADCALKLERGVGAMPGVRQAQVNFTLGQMTLGYDPQAVSREEIAGRVAQRVRELGYDVAEEGPLGGGSSIERARDRAGQARGWRGLLAALRQRGHAVSVVVAGALIGLAFGLRWVGASQAVSHALYVAATIVAGYANARAGWAALRTTRSLDMNVLMTLAAVGALAVGEFEEGAVATFLFSLGNLLESATLDRARARLRALMGLAPPQATRLRAAPPLPSPPEGRGRVREVGVDDGAPGKEWEERVPVEALAVGDRILVRPGERIPMDGRVLTGHSAVNQAPITGESMPVEKGPGDEVFAGTVNASAGLSTGASAGLSTASSGALTIEVTRLAADNTLSRIIHMVEQAGAQKAPAQRFVDRFARVYTPVVVLGALLVAVVPPLVGAGPFAMWLRRALVLLVIACPCALVISTPVTIVSGIARAARAGVLVKGGAYLEQVGSLRVVAFDKTGTLTRGKPVVVAGRCSEHAATVRPQDCPQCRDLLAKAAALEVRSEHLLAQAIVEQARAFGVERAYAPAEEVEALAGQGVRGQVGGHHVTVGSHAYIHGGRPLEPFCEEVDTAAANGQTTVMIEDECCGQRGYVAVADTLRETVPQAIADLRRAGIRRIVMLTGDNEGTARAIASAAGVDEFHANLLPQQKVQAVERLLARHGQVAMVGDGINDTPALARATVGIVMGAAGSDAALETADIALMADDLTQLPFIIRLSRQVLSIIRQNVAFALLIKALFLALALAGSATLWMAVFADMGASLLVIFNGMRVLGYRGQRSQGG